MEAIFIILLVLIFCLVVGWIVVGSFKDFRDGGKDFDGGEEPADPILENQPNTELARKVWAAHTANQTLDFALLTGDATQIKDAEAKATVANSHLVAYLTERASQ